jgi:hypothetical protein
LRKIVSTQGIHTKQSGNPQVYTIPNVGIILNFNATELSKNQKKEKSWVSKVGFFLDFIEHFHSDLRQFCAYLAIIKHEEKIVVRPPALVE